MVLPRQTLDQAVNLLRLGDPVAPFQQIAQRIQTIQPKIRQHADVVLFFGKGQRQPLRRQFGIVFHRYGQPAEQGRFTHAAHAENQAMLRPAAGSFAPQIVHQSRQ